MVREWMVGTEKRKRATVIGSPIAVIAVGLGMWLWLRPMPTPESATLRPSWRPMIRGRLVQQGPHNLPVALLSVLMLAGCYRDRAEEAQRKDRSAKEECHFEVSPSETATQLLLSVIVIRELTGGIYFGKPQKRWTNSRGRQAVDTLRYSEKEIRRILHVGFQ